MTDVSLADRTRGCDWPAQQPPATTVAVNRSYPPAGRSRARMLPRRWSR